MILAFAATCARFRSVFGRFWISVGIVVLVVTVFALARAGAIRTAQKDYVAQSKANYPAYSRVALNLLQDEIEPGGSPTFLADLGTSDCGRLVLFSNERLFLIRPVEGRARMEIDTFVIPWSSVGALRLRANEYTNCP